MHKLQSGIEENYKLGLAAKRIQNKQQYDPTCGMRRIFSNCKFGDCDISSEFCFHPHKNEFCAICKDCHRPQEWNLGSSWAPHPLEKWGPRPMFEKCHWAASLRMKTAGHRFPWSMWQLILPSSASICHTWDVSGHSSIILYDSVGDNASA